MERVNTYKALNILSYSQKHGFNRKGLIHDVGALSTEVGTSRPIIKRTFKTLEALVGENVINWPADKNKDALEHFAPNSEGTLAGHKIREVLVNEPAGTMFAWFCPDGGPENHDEGRLRIGIVKNKMGFKILESY